MKNFTKIMVATCIYALLSNIALIAVNATPLQQLQQQQPLPELNLQPTADGFSGTCKVDDETVLLEARHLTKKSARSRLQRSDGRPLVEVLRDGDSNTVEIKFPSVKIAMDMTTQSFIDLTEKDKEKLQKFLASSDATLARKCIARIIQTQWQGKERKFIPLGFTLAGMLLGDEPSIPSIAPQSKTEPLHRLILAQTIRQPKNNLTKAVLACGTRKNFSIIKSIQNPDCPQPGDGCFGGPECNGCCGGPNCTCSGYYTNECLAHDNCVGHYGQVACLGVFPAAAGSLVRAIRDGGDWPAYRSPSPRHDEPLDEFYYY